MTGPVLGPFLVGIFINSLDHHVLNASFPLYAYDTVVYCTAPTLIQVLYKLNTTCDSVQQTLWDLKLVSCAGKSKFVFIKKLKEEQVDLLFIPNLNGTEIELETIKYKNKI